MQIAPVGLASTWKDGGAPGTSPGRGGPARRGNPRSTVFIATVSALMRDKARTGDRQMTRSAALCKDREWFTQAEYESMKAKALS